MTKHKIGTQEEWQAERAALLEEEKELTRRSDELARKRQGLPWVRRRIRWHERWLAEAHAELRREAVAA